jgi:hypothetical protein
MAGTPVGTRGRCVLKSITDERLLTLAMLADARDETAAVMRFCGTKDYAPIIVSDVISRIDVFVLQCADLLLSGVGIYTQAIC